MPTKWIGLHLCASILCAQTSTLLVLEKAANSLAFYTPAGAKIALVPVGKHPHEMVVSPDGRYLYCTDNGTMRIEQPGTGGNTVSIVDLRARRKVGEISLGEYRRPHGIDIDGAGRLAVSTELPDQLLIIDPKARRIVQHFATKGQTSHMVTLGPGGRYAYVSNSNSGAVSAIDLASGAVTLIATGPRPEGSVLSRDGRYLYVGNRNGSTISIIDTTTQKKTGDIECGKGPVRIAMTPDGKWLVYALYNENKVEIADPAAHKVVAQVALPEQPVSLKLSRDGSLAFASAEDKDTIYVIAVAQRRIVRQIKTDPGSGPDPVMEMPRPARD